MTLPSAIRVFFAVDLPDPTKEKIGSFIAVLKKRAKSHAIRWTQSQNLHITLQFLAEIKTAHLSFLIENVRNNLATSIENAHLALGNVHLFPNPYRPRVIVLQVSPQLSLAHLSNLIGKGITSSNYKVDDRPFRAHLTLGRIKYARGVNLDFLSEFKIFPLLETEVKEVVLFRSEPQQQGSKYTVLAKIVLEHVVN